MNANVWMASAGIDVRSILMTANHSRVRIMESALMKFSDFRVTAVEPAMLETYVKRTSMNAPEIRAKTTASALTIMAVTHASVDQASAAKTAIKLSTNVNLRRVSTVAPASRRIKVTLSAFVAKVFRDNFVKLHPNAPIVPMIRNVWMVGVFASKA